MTFKYIIFLIFVLSGQNLFSQNLDSLNQEASPIGGINNLAVKFYGIDFTKEQRALIKDTEIEFIFLIDEKGEPILSDVNGISDQAIIDSLRMKTIEVPFFNPNIIDGVATSSIYFMTLRYPTYNIPPVNSVFSPLGFKRLYADDFDYLTRENNGFDMLIGGMFNQYLGNQSQFMGFGGGMKTDMSITNKNSLLFGLGINANQNKVKMDWPISTVNKQLESQFTMVVSGFVGKWFDDYSVRFELGYVQRFITEYDKVNSDNNIVIKGLSPGLAFNYVFQFGKEEVYYHFRPGAIGSHNLNLSMSLRYDFLSIPEASGLMLDIGVAYRIRVRRLSDFKIKNDILFE